MSSGTRWLVLVLATGIVACEALLVDPAVTEHELRFSLSSATAGAMATAVSELDRVWIAFSHGEQAWDTVLRLEHAGGALKARMSLPPLSGGGPITIEAELGSYHAAFFRGSAHVPTGYGLGTVVTVPVNPIVSGLAVPSEPPVFAGLGESVVLEATVLLATGDTLHGAVVTWTSDDPLVVEIVDGNRVVPRGNGETRVRTSYEDLMRSLLATVQQVPAVFTGVAPADTTLTLGDRLRLRPFGLDVTGHALLPGSQVSWRASGPLTVDGLGWVSGTSPGTGFIHASAAGELYIVRVTVEGG